MASRKRNRALGIAALIGAMAAIVVVILISQGGRTPVTPLREEPAKPKSRAERHEDSGLGTGWLATPVPRSRSESRIRRSHNRKARDRKDSVRTGGHRAVKSPPGAHEGTRRARHMDPASPRRHSIPAPTRTAPAPSLAPAAAPAPVSTVTPPAAAERPPVEESDTRPGGSPEKPATPESRPVEIRIEDGELETELDRVHPKNGQVRLRIRSDQFVVVEVEGHGLSWAVPAGKDTLIEFATHSTRGFELELRRRKGVLVLRLDT